MRRLPLLLLGTLLAACSADVPEESRTPGPESTYFAGFRLVPGDGGEVLENAAMVVAEGRIASVGRAGDVEPPEGSVRVDLAGRTVIPALINLHGHPGWLVGARFAADNYSRDSILEDLRRYAYFGVGAVVAQGTDPGDVARTIQEEQRRGELAGARLFTAGRGITAKGGWPTVLPALAAVPYQVTTEQEARTAVAELAAQRVDLVKIWVDDNLGRIPKLTPEVYRAVVEEAQRHGLRVVAHVFTLADAKDLIRSGVAGLVHSVRDRDVDAELIELMKERNAFYVPTLTAHESTFVYADAPPWLSSASMRDAYPLADIAGELSRDQFVEGIRKNPDLPKFREQYAVAQRNLEALAEGGVRIGFGTDTGTANRFVGYFEHRELELMVEAGLTPMEAIAAATGTSAGVLGVSDIGTIAPAQQADFIVLAGNPLEAIANTRDIVSVYRAGRMVDRAALLRAPGRTP
jgi:imidazolonepropionase-like amidohydrolase